MKVRNERVASVELLSFLDSLLFSLSLSKDFETRFFPSFKGHQGCCCSKHNDCDFPMTDFQLLVAFPSFSRTVTVFAMHFIS